MDGQSELTVEAGAAQGRDTLDRVGLGANGTDDGGAAVLLGGVVLSVELAEPFNPGPASIEVVQSVNSMSVSKTLIKDSTRLEVQSPAVQGLLV